MEFGPPRSVLHTEYMRRGSCCQLNHGPGAPPKPLGAKTAPRFKLTGRRVQSSPAEHAKCNPGRPDPLRPKNPEVAGQWRAQEVVRRRAISFALSRQQPFLLACSPHKQPRNAVNCAPQCFVFGHSSLPSGHDRQSGNSSRPQPPATVRTRSRDSRRSQQQGQQKRGTAQQERWQRRPCQEKQQQ